MCNIEVGTCDICKKDNVPLQRKYYHYDIKCECHIPSHFEVICYCKDCIPEEPQDTWVLMNINTLKELEECHYKKIGSCALKNPEIEAKTDK